MIDKIIQIIGLFFFGFAVWLIGKDIEHIGWGPLVTLVMRTPIWAVSLALVFVVLDYIALSGYDFLSLRFVRKKIAVLTVFKTASLGFAVSNTAGHVYASGGAVRYWFYISAGLSRLDVVKVIAFETLMFFLGMGVIFVLAVLVMWLSPVFQADIYRRILGVSALIFLILFMGYLVFIVIPKKSITVHGIQLSAPTLRQTGGQIGISFLDNLCVSIVFYCLLRGHFDVSFWSVFAAFNIAQVIGLTTQIPGGMGVLEGMFLYLFPHPADQKGMILASLIVFRVLYFFIPFGLAVLFLIVSKIRSSVRLRIQKRA